MEATLDLLAAFHWPIRRDWAVHGAQGETSGCRISLLLYTLQSLEFACSLHVCLASLQILRLPVTVQRRVLSGLRLTAHRCEGFSVSLRPPCQIWRPLQGLPLPLRWLTDQRAAGVNTEHHEPPSYFTNSLWTTRIRKEGARCLPHCFIALYVWIGLSSFLLSCVSSHLTSVTPSDIRCLISFTRYSWRYLSLVCLVTCQFAP